MKFIRNKYLKVYNQLIAYLLGLMGFAAACIPEPVEYGIPQATFKLKGTVQSNETSLYIPNIKVIMGYDTTYTDAGGNFQISQIEMPDEQTFIVRFLDVDDASNEHLDDIDTTITFIDPVFTGSDGKWYKGETEKSIEIKMNPYDGAR
jgi:putative lipoprotein (rSAM/lipoprotein system)